MYAALLFIEIEGLSKMKKLYKKGYQSAKNYWLQFVSFLPAIERTGKINRSSFRSYRETCSVGYIMQCVQELDEAMYRSVLVSYFCIPTLWIILYLCGTSFRPLHQRGKQATCSTYLSAQWNTTSNFRCVLILYVQQGFHFPKCLNVPCGWDLKMQLLCSPGHSITWLQHCISDIRFGAVVVFFSRSTRMRRWC